MLANSKVLLVEDTPILQKINILLLKRLGCKVTLAKCGTEAVNIANTKRFNIIFMDIGLPDFSGIEATKSIRKNFGANSHTPIIALTTHSEDIKESCLEAGMDDFLRKPSPLFALNNAINRWTQQRGQTMAYASML